VRVVDCWYTVAWREWHVGDDDYVVVVLQKSLYDKLPQEVAK